MKQRKMNGKINCALPNSVCNTLLAPSAHPQGSGNICERKTKDKLSIAFLVIQCDSVKATYPTKKRPHSPCLCYANLAWAPIFVSFSRCFSTSRPSEIKRGGRELDQKRDRLVLSSCKLAIHMLLSRPRDRTKTSI